MTDDPKPAEQDNSILAGNDVTIGGDFVGRDKVITVHVMEDVREKQYRIALNWDKRTSLRGFDLAGRNLEKAAWPGADLIGSNLAGADLREADLRRANLRACQLAGANFADAVLVEADLFQSNATWEQLRPAARLRKVRLPDGELYDGRFNLAGDIQACQAEAYQGTFHTGGALAAVVMPSVFPPENFVAWWYGISKQKYLAGQLWAKQHGLEPFLPYYSLAYRAYAQKFKDRLK